MGPGSGTYKNGQKFHAHGEKPSLYMVKVSCYVSEPPAEELHARLRILIVKYPQFENIEF
jgi:hypothetical protein